MANSKKTLLALFVLFFGALIFWPQKVYFIHEGEVAENKLAIPRLLEPKVVNGEKVFELEAEQGMTEFFSGKPAPTYGFNQSYLGPTLRISKGDVIRIAVSNSLREPITAHWHGAIVPGSEDGGPANEILPGASWISRWTVKNDAATLWYHAHEMGLTAPQVYRGLAGLLLVDDAESASFNLPREYGVDDIPLLVQDRKFDYSGKLVYDHVHGMHMGSGLTAGMLGDTILVNGTRIPYLEAPKKLVRFRIVNASNARRYYFGFSDDREFYQIASDGGFLSAPVQMNRVLLSPGERAEVLVDLSKDDAPLSLMSYAVPSVGGSIQKMASRMFLGDSDQNQKFTILEIRPVGEKLAASKLPQVLSNLPETLPRTTETTRTFVLEASTINGMTMNMRVINESVQKDETEVWEIFNNSPIAHPFHVHGVQFRIIEKDGASPEPGEAGFKDTVLVNPQEDVRIAVRFTETADAQHPYMYHCHILEHEDMGMMGQFTVE